MTFGRRVSGGESGSVVIGGNNVGPITTTVVQGASRHLRDVYLDPSATLGGLDLDEIVGRDWAYRAIDEFVRTQPRGYFLIEAAAGMGKTTLAASLALKNSFPAHFGEATRRDPTGVALANLAVQLIEAYELEEFAPGGALPASAADPVWFGSVLAASAEVVRRDSGRLILVVDGVDEMMAHPSGRPLGLPLVLPDSVYFVLTCRTGTRLSLGSPSKYMQISANQSENLADVRLFVERFARKHLVDKLGRSGMSESGFVESITAASGGLWVYLKHLCDDVREGRQRPDGLDGLPKDLSQYYIDYLHRCLVECADRGDAVRLFAALASARDPVSVETLAAFSGVASQDVSSMCRGPMMPLLRERRDTDLVRYSMYHRSLVEALTETTPASSSGHQATVDELHEALPPAHLRIAQHYLRLFGGLDEGLPILANDPTAAEVDQRYPLHHLVEHLNVSGAQDRLHRLLTVGAPSRAAWAGVWFIAHEQAGTLYRYLADVDMAWSAAERETEQALARNGIAKSLGSEVWYAVLAAMAADRVQQIPKALLRRLVEAGQWDLSQSIEYALALHEPAEQIDALTELYPLAPSAEQDRIRSIILQSLHHLRLDARAPGGLGTLESVARTLPENDLPRLLDMVRRRSRRAVFDVEHFLRAVTSSHPAKVAELAEATPMFGRDRVLREPPTATGAVRWATKTLVHHSGLVSSDDLRVTAALVLAGRMPTPESDDVVALCAAFASSQARLSDQARCLAPLLRLAPSDPITQMAADLLVRCRDTDDYERASILRNIIADLPGDLLPSALAAAQTLPLALAAPILTSLAPRLNPTEFVSAMQTIQALPPSHAATQALATIVGSVPARLFPDALAVTTDLGDENQRDQVMAVLAGNTPAEHAETMLDHARRVTSPEYRSLALARLLPHMHARQARKVGSQAIEALTELHLFERARSANIVVPLLPTALLREALVALQSRDHYEYSRIVAGAALTPYLAESRRERACTRLLAGLVPYAKGESTHRALKEITAQLPDSALERAAELARSIWWRDLRQISLSRVAARAQGELRQRILGEVLPSLESGWQPAAFRLVAPIITEEQRDKLVAVALKSVTDSTDKERWSLLRDVQDWVTEPERGSLVEQAVNEAISAPSEMDNEALTAVTQLTATHMPGRLGDLLDALAAIPDPYKCGAALCAIADALTEDQASIALLLIQHFDGHQQRDVITALAPRLPRAIIETMYSELLAKSSTWINRHDAEKSARRLVAYYLALMGSTSGADTAGASRKILDLISRLEDHAERVDLVAALIPTLSVGILDEAIQLCCTATPTTPLERSRLSSSLARAARNAHLRAGGIADPQVRRLFRHALRTADSLNLLQTVIPETAALIADYGGDRAIENCMPLA
ncbi:hypothetical protein ACLQ3B_33010 [Micromonospora sp. DT53]|uniref:hypothetical protein n=1 Tax=Micromonospora sp. DT53 TaxID=3393444 RepID=UPI003CFB9921